MLCAAALVVYVYHQDRYDREPWHAVLIAVATGFGMMWLLGLADDYAIHALDLTNDRFIAKAATIALIEEGGKLITVMLLAFVLVRRYFNDPMDGLIYGRLAGVGIAMQESLLYLSISPPTLQTLGIEIVRLFAHSLMAALVGFAIGLGARRVGKREHYPRLVLLCLALSTTMHFGWNVVAYSRPTDPLARLLPMAMMLTMMILWRWFCNIAQARSREFFAPAQVISIPA
jgi:RsiW-degrading membrane proteinase PrsW (M82 family)